MANNDRSDVMSNSVQNMILNSASSNQSRLRSPKFIKRLSSGKIIVGSRAVSVEDVLQMREENFFDFQEVKDEGNMLMLELSADDNQYEIIPLDDE